MRSPHPSLRPRAAAATGRHRGRVGLAAAILGGVALAGGAITSAYVGVTIGPMEATAGHYLSDTPRAYQQTVAGAGASLAVWSLCGITAITLGALALSRAEQAARPVTGIIASVAAPLVWIGAFTLPALTSASLLG